MNKIDRIKDPLYVGQWNLEIMHVRETWDTGQGADVPVGLVDSGIDGSHADFGWTNPIYITANDSPAAIRSKYGPVMRAIQAGTHPSVLPGWDFISNTSHTWDFYRHGTYLAGTIGARINDVGMVGVAPLCKIRPYVVIDPDGYFQSYTAVKSAILKACEDGCQVINMSLAWFVDRSAIRDAIDEVTDKGVIVVAATGNKNKEGIAFPARYDNTIAVGGCDHAGRRWVHNGWRGSSWGEGIDCVAPGAPQTTTRKMRNRYARIDGTSQACANASGVFALLKGINPDVTTAMIKALLQRNDWNPKTGHGVINAFRLAQAVTVASKPCTKMVDFKNAILQAVDKFGLCLEHNN